MLYKGLSLFSNAGIGDFGVEMTDVDILIANELLKERSDTYSLNHPHTTVFNEDVNNFTNERFQTLKENYFNDGLFLLVSTPPCQGVSLAGRRDKCDIRNQLIKPTVRAIKVFLPLWVWIENVPAYAQAKIPNYIDIVEDDGSLEQINIIDFLKQELEPLGYKLKTKVLNAKDYGVPQSRKRLITILTRTDKEISFPEITHGEKEGLLPYVTVRDAIGHLEPLESGEKSETDIYHRARLHPERHIEWMKHTPEGQTALNNQELKHRPNKVDKITGEIRPIKAYQTTYKRMWWDKPAPTVTMASGNISSQNNVHPRDTRALTIREIMILQTIPDTFRFPDYVTENEIREMIGEAVPCLLAKTITQHIINVHNG